MRGQGPWAELIRTRVAIACRKHGLGRWRYELRTDLFRPPVLPGAQMSLF